MMKTNHAIEVRNTSAFKFEMVPIRRSAFIESSVDMAQIEAGLQHLSPGRLQVYLGHRVEYSLASNGLRLIATVGALGKGVVGIAIDYWGNCEQEFQELVTRIQQFASGS